MLLETLGCVSFQISVSVFPGYIPKSGVAGPYGSSILVLEETPVKQGPGGEDLTLTVPAPASLWQEELP